MTGNRETGMTPNNANQSAIALVRSGEAVGLNTKLPDVVSVVGRADNVAAKVTTLHLSNGKSVELTGAQIVAAPRNAIAELALAAGAAVPLIEILKV